MGMRADGILLNDTTISTLIPRKFDRKKWHFKEDMKKITLTDSENRTVVFTAGPGCRLECHHYGGKAIEINASTIYKQINHRQKAGQETKISYTIEFGKGE